MATTTTRKKHYTWFIGTDISRNKPDYAVMKGSRMLFHKETGNDADSIREFITERKAMEGFTIAKAMFCMENTGFYGNLWINGLKKYKANVVRENSRAIMNAQVEQLQKLTTLRNRIISSQAAMTVPVGESTSRAIFLVLSVKIG